jgi:large subunit ribosomal protein L24
VPQLPAAPVPATKPDVSKPDDSPAPAIANVPVPDNDPRRGSPKPNEAAPKKPVEHPHGADAPTGHVVAPLPPPIEVRPVPGVKTAPKPHAPLILTPPAAREQRPGL